MLQPFIHYGIHFGLPLAIALVFFKSHWKLAYIVMASCILIDVDHVFATPMFDAHRCSINFHPLHSYAAMVVYVILLCFIKTRILGIGLVVHIVADTVDCAMM